MYTISQSFIFLLFTLLSCPQRVISVTIFNRTLSNVGGTGVLSSTKKASSSRDLKPVVSGSSAADKCWSAWDAYSTSSTRCPETTITAIQATWTTKVISVIRETYKLCDGHPRAVAPGGERTATTTGEVRSGGLTTYTDTLPPSGVPLSTLITTKTNTTTYYEASCASPIHTPRCSIGNDDCRALFSAWTAGGFSRIRPPCTYALPTDRCNDCVLYIPSVKLMYFPVSMTGDLCGGHTTVTSLANVSTPTTVVVSGTTFTSGFAYLSYAGITASAGNGQCGTPKPAGVLPIPSSRVSSYRGHDAAMEMMGDVQWPFNFADLAPNPVPWDAWISQETCFTHQFYPSCQTITQAAYRPWIVYPSAFWSMEPQWSNCVSGIFGIMDPPTALPTAQGIDMPMSSTQSVKHSMPAAPQMTVTKTLAEPTSTSRTLHGDLDPETTSAISADGTAARPRGETAKKESHTVTEKQVQTKVLQSSTIAIGTVQIVAASQDGAISVGANLLSEHRAFTIGNTIVSSGSQTLVVQVEPTASAVHSDPDAVSILAAAYTSRAPYAEITLDAETYTAYSGGIVIAAGTTTMLPEHHAVLDGHTISLGRNGVFIDSTSYDFKPPRRRTETDGGHNLYSASRTADGVVAATYVYGSSHLTLYGHVDPAGHTIMTLRAATFTYNGQEIVSNGVTYSVEIPPRIRTTVEDGSKSRLLEQQSALPSIVSGSGITSKPSAPPSATSNARTKPVGSTQATSTSSVAIMNVPYMPWLTVVLGFCIASLPAIV